MDDLEEEITVDGTKDDVSLVNGQDHIEPNIQKASTS